MLGIRSYDLVVGELPTAKKEVLGGDGTARIRISACERSKFEQV